MKKWLLPGVAVIGGVAGLLIRRAYLANDFDPVSGLPVAQPRFALPLYGVTAVVLVLLLLLSLGKHRRFDRQYSSAFYARTPFWFILAAAGGVLLFAGGLLILMDFFRPDDLGMAVQTTRAGSILMVLLGAVSVLAGAGICLTILATRRKGEYRSGWITLPGFVCCLWVMSCYQDWAKDPVTSHYLYPLLAVLLAMIACYLIPAFAFGKGKVTAALFFSSAAAAVGIMNLDIGGSLYVVALRLGLILWLLAMTGTLADNASRPAPPAVLPAGCAPADCAACPGCTPEGSRPASDEPTDNA